MTFSRKISADSVKPSGCFQFERKQLVKNIACALTVIFAVGAIVAGALGIFRIYIFSAIGSMGSQALAYGGAALFAVATLAKAIDFYCQKRQHTSSSIRRTPKPTNKNTKPPPKKVTEPIKHIVNEPIKPISTFTIDSVELADLPLAKPNNLPPKLLPHKTDKVGEEFIGPLKKASSTATRHLGTIDEFHESSQTAFIESCTGYFKGAGFSSTEHFKLLEEERIESLETVHKHHDRPLEVTVVGGGPAGSLAALEAYLAGANVHLVEKREAYTRDRMLRLSLKTASFLEQRFGHIYTIASTQDILLQRRQGFYEEEFFGTSDFVVVETRDLEWMLNLLLYEIAEKDEGLKIYREHEFTGFIEKEDESCVAIRNKEGAVEYIKSDWVVGADGMHSSVRKEAKIKTMPLSKPTASAVATFPNFWGNNVAFSQLESFVPEAIKEGYVLSKQEEKHIVASKTVKLAIRPHIEANIWKEEESEVDRFRRFKIARTMTVSKEEMDAEMELAKLGGKKLHTDMSEMGWEKERLPSNRLFASTHTIYVGTDIPASELENMGKNPELIKPWIAKTLEQNLPKEAITLLMSQMRYAEAFVAQLVVAKTVVKKSDHLTLFLIGDSTGTPHFQTGSGADKALHDSRAFGDLVRSWGATSDEEEFAEAMNSYSKELVHRTEEMHNKAFAMGFASD